MGDLNKRRGRVLGMEPSATRMGYTVVEADVPQSEMSDYVIVLRAMTQGRGSYDFNIQTYEEVPGNIAQKVIEEAKKNQE
jgi:elongation factor G